MICKILLLAICAVAFAQGDEYEALKKATDDGVRKVLEVANKIRDPRKEYESMIQERLECLTWEHVTQMHIMNDSVTSAVFRGMTRNNKFENFQCVSNVARETYAKIKASSDQILNIANGIVEKGLGGVRPLRLILPGLSAYVQDLYKTKYEEMKKAKNGEERLKILDMVLKKMKHLDAILGEVEKKATANKFKFFEEFVKYAYDNDNYLKKTAREGGQKALKCIS